MCEEISLVMYSNGIDSCQATFNITCVSSGRTLGTMGPLILSTSYSFGRGNLVEQYLPTFSMSGHTWKRIAFVCHCGGNIGSIWPKVVCKGVLQAQALWVPGCPHG